MSHADLSAARWQELSDESAAGVARTIARENQLDLIDVRDHDYAGRRQRIALFERDGTRFSLVPADRVSLGYDGADFVPSPAQAASYADSAGEYGLPDTITEYVDSMTSPRRTMDLPATLVAVETLNTCLYTPVAPDDPRLTKFIARARPGLTAKGHIPGWNVWVEFDSSGQVRTARMAKEPSSYHEALEGAASLGVRPSSPDEWEYACGAGTSTLFRWGNDTPDGGYPYDHQSGQHQEPNHWGLLIGQDPYRHEWTTQPGTVCGGDGGSTTCGGNGYFVGWLALATAYRDAQFGAWLISDEGYIDEVLIRAVIDLS